MEYDKRQRSIQTCLLLILIKIKVKAYDNRMFRRTQNEIFILFVLIICTVLMDGCKSKNPTQRLQLKELADNISRRLLTMILRDYHSLHLLNLLRIHKLKRLEKAFGSLPLKPRPLLRFTLSIL
jgi:hypothetical protein